MNKNLRYYILVLFSIIISLGIYKFRSWNIDENKIKKSKSIDNIVSENISHQDIKLRELFNNENYTVQFPYPENVLFVLIKRGDCYDCYKDIPFLNRFSDRMDNTKTFIVVQKDETKYMKEFIPNNNIKLPVMIDESNKFFNIMDSLKAYTPLYLFVRKDGEIIYKGNSNYGVIEKQEIFIEEVKKKLK